MDTPVVVHRLSHVDVTVARRTFALMAEVFGETAGSLGDAYLEGLLDRRSFWAYTAEWGAETVGGLTAHELPMTRSASAELLIYDLAVHSGHQRRGVGTALIQQLRRDAAAAGIDVVFVPADNDDEHALSFYRTLGGDPAPVTIFTFERP